MKKDAVLLSVQLISRELRDSVFGIYSRKSENGIEAKVKFEELLRFSMKI